MDNRLTRVIIPPIFRYTYYYSKPYLTPPRDIISNTPVINLATGLSRTPLLSTPLL